MIKRVSSIELRTRSRRIGGYLACFIAEIECLRNLRRIAAKVERYKEAAVELGRERVFFGSAGENFGSVAKFVFDDCGIL